MAVNKIVYAGNSLIDLTDDTVTADKLSEGITAHDKSGNKITGTMTSSGSSQAKEPYIEETYDTSGNLIDVRLYGYNEIRTYAFFNCSKLALTSLPSGITSIGDSAFRDCSKLSLTSLPSGITSIGNYTFYGCSKLSLTSLPSGITSIRAYAFNNCSNLTSLTFKGTPKTIISNAFKHCSKLRVINVPWAEGTVANAPWGATDATINYNYNHGWAGGAD